MNDHNTDKDVLFVGDAIAETKKLITMINKLASDYDVHPYTLSLGFIRASSVMGAVAATAIYNASDEYSSKSGAASKVLQIYKEELFEIIGNASDTKGVEH